MLSEISFVKILVTTLSVALNENQGLESASVVRYEVLALSQILQKAFWHFEVCCASRKCV